jgi:signal transduction histidine kinase
VSSVAELPRSSLRTVVVLVLALVALFEVVAVLQGVRSARRLQARVLHDAEQRVAAVRPRIDAALARGGAASWAEAAALVLGLGLASEVEVLDRSGRSLFARPAASPVSRALRKDQFDRVVAGGTLTLAAQDGPLARALCYLPLPADGPDRVLRLAASAGDLEDELRERQQAFFGNLAALAALAVAALVLLRRPGEARASPAAAQHAYEQALERLRDQGERAESRHAEERRRMEEALREREAMARAGELTAGIAHEVRNGLGTILGYARLLERAGLGEDASSSARAIREECETLETVVRRFTDFVRVEQLHLAPSDLSPLLARVVAREQRAHDHVGARLVGLDEPLRIAADEELLERALENLVRNAVQAAEAGGGHVEVQAGRAGDVVEVLIDDDGPGLAPDHPERIQPFYTTRPGGLGLGLPLARKIILLHGGELELERRQPRGTRVAVRLPVDGPPS